MDSFCLNGFISIRSALIVIQRRHAPANIYRQPDPGRRGSHDGGDTGAVQAGARQQPAAARGMSAGAKQ